MSAEASNNDWEREGMVSLWIGDFASPAEFEDYFAEHIAEDAEGDDPINAFSAEFNLGYYDVGNQEANYNDGGALPVRAFLGRFSYSSSFIDAAAAAADRAGMTTANALVLLFDCDYKGGDDDGQLSFIGSFPYDKTAPPVDPQ